MTLLNHTGLMESILSFYNPNNGHLLQKEGYFIKHGDGRIGVNKGPQYWEVLMKIQNYTLP